MQIYIQEYYQFWQFDAKHIDATAVYSTHVDMLLTRLW